MPRNGIDACRSATFPLDTSEEKDLHGLVAASVPEGRRIEYKRELPGGNDKAKFEFVSDTTST